MKHIRLHNLQTHSIVCDIELTPDDLRLIGEAVKMIDVPDSQVFLTLANEEKVSLCLMPDTAFPIVRMT
jgi:hypothetical protein